jgi:aminomethyltransferase
LFKLQTKETEITPMAQNERTLLFPWHKKQGATIAVFHGWDMPLWYPAGAKKEHLSVITAAGMFDTSHMGAMAVSGADAHALLQFCYTKDLDHCLGPARNPLEAGRSVYGVFLNERGETIDDAIVFRLAKDRYLIVVNAGMAATVTNHLKKNVSGRTVQVENISARWAKIDLQGPLSARILARILKDGSAPLRKMVYFSFQGDWTQSRGFSGVALAGGAEIFLSRTGYTGEFGFELLMNPEHLLPVWESLLKAGEEFGITPCGLAARDSLRAGAGLPLSQQDIGPWPYINHPWHFALPFNDDGSGFTKRFIGEVVLQMRDSADYTLPYAGYDPRKVSVQDRARVLDLSGNDIGSVLTCVGDLAIGRVDGRIVSVASPDKPKDFKPLGLCCGFVKVKSKLSVGTPVILKDNRRQIEVEIRDDIRPNRTARRPIREFIEEEPQ